VVVWVEFKALWFFLPALDDVLIRGESVEGFKSLGEIVSVHEVKEVLSELPMVLVVIAFDGGFL
jgi:hypothetical protein